MDPSESPPIAPRVPQERTKPKQAVGLYRILLLLGGWFFVGMAIVGAILPGIPTTPWVLAAAYCFDRSSERFAAGLRRTPMFGKLIADWEQYRGVRKQVKYRAVGFVVVLVGLNITFTSLSVPIKSLIVLFASIGVNLILFVVPTADVSTSCKN
jgi:uncharacterized protein